MSTTYPITIQSITNPGVLDIMENINPLLDHDYQHSTVNDTIVALQTKLGVTGSISTNTVDYKLAQVTDRAVGLTAVQSISNKTITASTINGVTPSALAGASLYLAGDGVYKGVSASDASYVAKGSVQGLTDATTSGLNIAAGVISVNTGITANQIVKLDGTAKLPAVDGSQLTNVVISPTGFFKKEFSNTSPTVTGGIVSQYSIPANRLTIGSILRGKSYFNFANGSPSTFTTTISFGGVSILTYSSSVSASRIICAYYEIQFTGLSTANVTTYILDNFTGTINNVVVSQSMGVPVINSAQVLGQSMSVTNGTLNFTGFYAEIG